MNKVTFPSFNLEFNINRVAVEINNIKIYWYAILIVSAFILAIILCKRDDKKYDIKFENILEMLLFIIPISVISARIYYVIFKLEFYMQNPNQILNIQNGGLAIYGGIIGGVIAIAIYCKIKKIIFLDVLDYVVPYLSLGQAIGRWGNFFNIEAYGKQTTSFLRMGIIENGRYIEVHPAFLYESILDLIIFIILILMKNKRKYKGQITYVYLILYSFIRIIIEQIRTDSLMVGPIKISQLLSILIFVVFVVILIYNKMQENKKEVEL